MQVSQTRPVVTAEWLSETAIRLMQSAAAAALVTWMSLDLLCLDRFFTQKHGSKLFAEYGITGKKLRWNEDPAAFQRWKDGQTGLPLVDANMRELKQTGVPLLAFSTKRKGTEWAFSVFSLFLASIRSFTYVF